eukprot:11764789-Ditylum_brightwellii.AAC.1
MVLELQFDSRDSNSLTEGVSGFLFPSRDASAATAEADLNALFDAVQERRAEPTLADLQRFKKLNLLPPMG